MKIKNRILLLIGTAILLVLTLAGCTNNRASKTDQPTDTFTEPVTLTWFNYGASIITQQDLDKLVVKPVQAKYPNIQFQLITGKTLQNMVAAGETPDIISSSNYYMGDLLDLGLASDLNDFIKTDKVDLSRFRPGLFDVLKQFAKNGETYAIPYAMNYGVLVYNKDIFDKFGVPYPTDSMTLNQVIDLARRVTQIDNGTQYIGLDPGGADVWTRAYTLPTVDAQEKAILTSPGYVKVFSLLRQVYDIPGIVDPKTKKYSYGMDYFMKNQTLAMFPYWLNNLSSNITQLNASGTKLNWNVVSTPSFDDKPGYGRVIDFHLLTVPPNSPNKEAAYRVIQTMISDQAQEAMNANGALTILNNPELWKQYASNLNIYNGKNLAGVFKVKPAPIAVSTKYDKNIYTILNNAVKSMVLSNTDVNTALRDANDQADKYIQTVQSAAK